MFVEAWNRKELRFGMVAWAGVRALNQYHRLLTRFGARKSQPNQSFADSIQWPTNITINRELEVMIQLGGPMLVVTCIGMAFLRLLLSISAAPSIAVELPDSTWQRLRYVWKCACGCFQGYAWNRLDFLQFCTKSTAKTVLSFGGATFRYSLTRIRLGLTRCTKVA